MRKTMVGKLEVGDYVSALDRPWLDTPFLVQGFYVESEDDILDLTKYCEYVYVDEERNQARTEFKPMNPVEREKNIKEMFDRQKLEIYSDISGWKDEAAKATAAVESMKESMTEIYDNFASGRSIELLKVKKSVEPMIDSVVRNPDACLWLARMKHEDQYTYQHSMGCSIWTVALGRQLGLGKADLRTLAVGGLLFDVGKLRIDKSLLNNDRRLTEEEFEIVKQHVPLGVQSLRDGGVLNSDILDMAAYHHERHSGRGYPKGLVGNDIPVFARIAGIVDSYDAMTSQRAYARPMSPSQAIKALYQWCDVHFQAELVEEFIQAIGLYPAGTLVELSSGEVAIVVAESRTRRLRPTVMVLLDVDKNPVDKIVNVDLMKTSTTEDGESLEIVDSLEADAYGIDISAIELF